MSVRVMSAVWELDLPDSQKIVLLALADCANDEGHCWPSMKTLARKCSRGERTVQGVIVKLVDAGHLTRREVSGKGCNYSVHPRKDCTPARTAGRKDCGTPPQGLRETPAAAADKPSKNRKEPSSECASGDALAPRHVIDEWNLVAERTGRPKVRDPTPARQQLCRQRIAQYPLEDFATVFQKIADSPFLRGDTPRFKGATFDWTLQRRNFVKILEGNYDD